MAIVTLRPNATISNGWTLTNAATAHEALDDAVTQPTAGSEADGYLSSSTAAAVADLGLTSPSNVDTASAVDIYLEGMTAGDEDIQVSLHNAAGTILGTAATHNVATTYGWWKHSITGLTLTQADVDGLSIRITPIKAGPMSEVRCRVLYADLTYTPTAELTPAIPTGLIPTNQEGSVKLDWTAVTTTGIDGYNVYRSATPGGVKTKLNTALITVVTYTDTVVAGTYYYTITAVNNEAATPESGFSTEVEGVSLAAAKNTSAIFGWPTPGGKLTGSQVFYAIVRRSGAGGNPSAKMELLNNGVWVKDLTTNQVISGPTIISGTWNAITEAITDGTNIEMRIVGTGVAGGTLEIGNSTNTSNKWEVTFETLAGTAFQPSKILNRTNFSGSVELIQDNPSAPDTKRHWVNIDDAIKRRTRAELKRFTDWLTTNNAKGYLGEFGWPQTKDTYEWNRVADNYYDVLEDTNILATQWASGGNWPSTYVLLSYGESTATSAAEVVERHLEKGTLYRGVNVAGAEFSHNTLANGTLFSNVNPGVHGTDYFYPSAAHLNYIAGRGVKTIRLPFRWERLQRSLLGVLDATEIGLVNQVLVNANTAGLKVILDCHNYARYMLGTNTTTRTELIMTKNGDLNYTHLNDFWVRVSQWVKADVTRDATVLGYGLMNEPNSMSPFVGPFAPNVTHSTFEVDIEGWLADAGVTLAHSTAQAHTGTGSLAVTKTFAATGYDQIRPRSADRAVGSRDLSANGNTMVARVFIPTTAPGANWAATLYLFDSAFANIQPGPDTPITKGQWTTIAVDFTTAQLTDVISMGIQVGASDINGTATIYIDQYEQGSGSGNLTSAEVWEGASQDSLNAIRNVPDNRLILVPGYNWSGVQNWTTYHADKWITDAQNNHMYEAHHYWDAINGYTGTYPDTYAAELNKAQTDGW